jgi:hypothetical protein
MAHAKLRADGIDELDELGAHHHRVHPGVVDDEGEFRARQAEVQRNEDRAQLPAGEEHLEELRHVERERRHPISVADTEVRERGRTAVDLLVELAICP